MRLFLALVLVTSLRQPDSQCNTPPMSVEYAKSFDLVVTGYTVRIDKSAQVVGFKIDSVFKGDVRYGFAIDGKTSDFTFQENTWYLLYANKLKDNLYTVSKCSRSAMYTEAFEEIKFLSQNMPCLGDKPKEVGACERGFAPICGCDGRTYGNICELSKHGILVYAEGHCDDRIKEKEKTN
jgi:hypothetical protein